MKHIASRQNPIVAVFRELARGREARSPLILLDGFHIVSEAVSAGIRMETALVSERLAASPGGASLLAALLERGVNANTATESVMRAASPVSTPAGVVAVAERRESTMAEVLRRTPQLLVASLDVQDPGNVGAIARAAEAGGATGAAFCGASADPFGWKALRGSMGSLLRLPAVASARLEEVAMAAREAGARVLAAVPHGGRSLYETDLAAPVAFLLGGEGPGLPGEAVALADDRVTIPMRPPVDSLNVAVAAALLVYEAARQRAASAGASGRRGS